MRSWRGSVVLVVLSLFGAPACSGGGGGGDAGPTSDAIVSDAPSADALDDAAPDAPRPDAGRDGGPGLGGADGLRYVIVPSAVDLTPDGTTALLWDNATGDAYTYGVDTGALSLRANAGDPTQDFPTAISADEAIAALHGVPVQAGLWAMADGWRDLAVPFASGCDTNVGAAWDVSADASVVVGLGWDGCYPAAVAWTLGNGGTVTPLVLQRLGARPAGAMGMPTNRATVVSDDGRVIGGFAETDMVDRWPAIWHADGTGMLLPGTTLDAPGEVLAISADGAVAAGIWNNEAFLWSEAGGVRTLGLLPGSLGGDAAYPNAIAAGGALVFGGAGGFGATVAFVWTEAAGMRPLTDVLTAQGIAFPADYTFSNVLAASTDGTVILGTVLTASGTPQSFVLRLPVSAYGL